MRITKTRDVKTPHRGTSKSAGIDFFVPNDSEPIFVSPGQSVIIPSGIFVEVPMGYMLTAFNKSGVASKKQLIMGACLVDADYQGEIFMNLLNVGNNKMVITPGEKICQFVLVPVFYDNIEIVESKDILYSKVSERGDGGFGSTGKK